MSEPVVGEARTAAERYRVYFCDNPAAPMKHGATFSAESDAHAKSRWFQDQGKGTDVVNVQAGCPLDYITAKAAERLAGMGYHLTVRELTELRLSQLHPALPVPQEPVADVPSGDTVLPELDAYSPEDESVAAASVCIGGKEAGIPFFGRHPHVGFAVAVELQCALTQRERQLRDYKAKYEAAQQALPWLPQPDSEGWWWRKFGPHMKPLEVIRMLTLPNETSGALYVPALGSDVLFCGGLWQKVADPR